jgi:hypothetical protein
VRQKCKQLFEEVALAILQTKPAVTLSRNCLMQGQENTLRKWLESNSQQ